MRKMHIRVILDVLVRANEGMTEIDRLFDGADVTVQLGDEQSDRADIEDITIESIQVTDSR